MSEKKRDLYFNVQNTIKEAKVQKYFKEREEIAKEGLTFWGYFNKKNDLQIEKLNNLKLKIQLLQTTNIELKEQYSYKELLADLYACAIEDLAGNFTKEMSSLYNEIKLNCDDGDSKKIEDEVYKMAVEKIAKSKNYLPVIHQEKVFLMFGNTRSQIRFLQLENQNIQNQIIKERGIKFETEFK